MRPGTVFYSTCCLTALLLPHSASADIKQIRIAHYIAADIATIPDDFMRYAHDCGYNYLLAHGNDIAASSGLHDWRNPATLAKDGSYDMAWAKANPSLYSKLKDLFKRADSCGLRVIPCFNTGSRWAGHWAATNANIARNMGTDGANPPHSWSVPVLIADPPGMDKSFLSYLTVVKKAFADAQLSYSSLEYVHIGHDEVAGNDGKLLIGRWNNAEQAWIRTNGNNADAYCRLMAEEVARRVNAVKTALPKTKAIIWADAWDPESNGGNTIITAWKEGGTVTVQTKNIAARAELKSIKKDLLLMPWQYQTKYDNKEYHAEKTLQYFKNNGFKVIVGLALDNLYAPSLDDSRAMVKKWVVVSNQAGFKDVVIGCCAHNWWDSGTYWNDSPRSSVFQIMPELAKEARFFPDSLAARRK